MRCPRGCPGHARAVASGMKAARARGSACAAGSGALRGSRPCGENLAPCALTAPSAPPRNRMMHGDDARSEGAIQASRLVLCVLRHAASIVLQAINMPAGAPISLLHQGEKASKNAVLCVNAARQGRQHVGTLADVSSAAGQSNQPGVCDPSQPFPNSLAA